MKKRSIALAVTVVVAAGIGLFLYGRRSGKEAPATQPSVAQPESNTADGAMYQRPQSESEEQYKARMRAEVEGEIAKNAHPEDARRYLDQRRTDPYYDWKQPIDFYGKVIDENARPVEGALVTFAWNDLSEAGTSRTTALSDVTGSFSLQGKLGKVLTVQVSKDGYHVPPVGSMKGFEYANPFEPHFHRPDQQNPVVFHLRKKGKMEPLVHGLKLFGTRIDGTPSYVDLVEGKNRSTPPGDLILRITRGERDTNRKFDWSVALEVPDGGLVESTNDFMFLAPEEGYQPSFEFTQQANDSNWVSQVKRKFYVRSRGGKAYSRVEVTFIPRYNEMAAVDIQYFFNPSGSRNLEYDPAMRLRP